MIPSNSRTRLVVIITLLFVFFQNCGVGFNAPILTDELNESIPIKSGPQPVTELNQSLSFNGDVFIVIGQSNAAVHGQTSQESSFAWNKTFSAADQKWIPLSDPLPMASNWRMSEFGGASSAGGSIWPIFADIWSAKTGKPVGIINLAWGGTTAAHWLDQTSETYQSQTGLNEPLLTRLIRVSNSIGGCQFKNVLWHQGESDAIAGTSKENYKAQLRALRDKFVSSTGCNQPWVIAHASFLPQSMNIPEVQMRAIREAQYELADGSSFMIGPDTDLMTSAKYRYDTLHFSDAGMRLHAELWANKLSQGISPQIDYSEYVLIPEVSLIVGLYQKVLSRSLIQMKADYNGLFYYSLRLQRNELSISEIEEIFRQSDEYLKKR